ncbi:MAG: hypothetical protein JNJ44_07470 [Zoogloeaceae bacterium]|nr:hypothetical protein [Zoogloeaceae bacterium]
MSLVANASQFTEIISRLFNSKPEDFLTSGPVFSDFDGPNMEEVKAMIAFLRQTYEPLIASGELTLITKTAFNTLIGQAQASHNTFTQLTNTRDQSSFQNFAMTLDGFAYHTRMFGIPYLAAGGAQLEAQRAALASEVQLLTRNNAEVEALKKDVRTLITPAIAGSLSEAFRVRRDALFKGRMLWFTICIISGAAAIYATFDFVHVVSSAIAAPTTPTSLPTGSAFWPVIAIRTVVLLPLFAACGFAFGQYKKERDFEEEYAHKAAVANSLPNYGDIAREQSVRDQIVTAATSVIFSSPSEQARKAETSNALLGSMRDLMDAVGKGLGKK